MERESAAFSDGFKERAFQVSGGAQYDTGGQWIVGGALSIEDRELNQLGAPASGDGYQFQGGLVAKYGAAPLQLSAAVSGGYSSLDSVRLVGADRLRAESDQDIRFFSGRFGLGHTLESENVYMKSSLDLGFSRVAMEGYTEQGGSGMNLRVADAAASYLSSRLAVELGYETRLRDGAVLRPTLGFGVTRFWNDQAPDLRAAFVAAPMGSGDFAVASEMDSYYIDLGAGLDVVTANGTVVRFSGRRQFADRFEATSANLELSFRF